MEPIYDESGEAFGCPRVWYLAQVAPGLAMARSIGDAVGAMVGVIAEPEVSNQELKPEDNVLIIASDGLWEFLSSEKVLEMTIKKLREKPPVTEQSILETACFLADEARKEWKKEDEYVDDITVIICVMQHTKSVDGTKERAPSKQMTSTPRAAPGGKGRAGGKPGGGKRGAVSSETTKRHEGGGEDTPLKCAPIAACGRGLWSCVVRAAVIVPWGRGGALTTLSYLGC